MVQKLRRLHERYQHGAGNGYLSTLPWEWLKLEERNGGGRVKTIKLTNYW